MPAIMTGTPFRALALLLCTSLAASAHASFQGSGSRGLLDSYFTGQANGQANGPGSTSIYQPYAGANTVMGNVGTNCPGNTGFCTSGINNFGRRMLGLVSGGRGLLDSYFTGQANGQANGPGSTSIYQPYAGANTVMGNVGTNCPGNEGDCSSGINNFGRKLKNTYTMGLASNTAYAGDGPGSVAVYNGPAPLRSSSSVTSNPDGSTTTTGSSTYPTGTAADSPAPAPTPSQAPCSAPAQAATTMPTMPTTPTTIGNPSGVNTIAGGIGTNCPPGTTVCSSGTNNFGRRLQGMAMDGAPVRALKQDSYVTGQVNGQCNGPHCTSIYQPGAGSNMVYGNVGTNCPGNEGDCSSGINNFGRKLKDHYNTGQANGQANGPGSTSYYQPGAGSNMVYGNVGTNCPGNEGDCSSGINNFGRKLKDHH